MSQGDDTATGALTVRYWAAIRAAAGVETDRVEVGPEGLALTEILDEIRARHRDAPRFADLLAVCSVLVGEHPVARAAQDSRVVLSGETVELLPPYAGG